MVFILTSLTIADIDFFDEETLGRVALTLMLGYLWFGISQLVAEAKNLNSFKHIAMVFLGFIPLLFITFGDVSQLYRLVLIIPAFLLLIMVAPYIDKKRHDNRSVWVFNRQLWFGVAVAIVAALILAAGTSAALAAVDYLFDLNIKEKTYLYILSFCGLILAPIYALSFIPRQFDFNQEECHVPSQVNLIVNWIFAPLIIVYMTILYAYFIKIGVNWEIPKGQLSFMITGFIGAGLVIYMISWPLHETRSKALNFFAKYFFIAMLVPIIFQAVSIGMRIDQYGFTQKRYIVAAAVFWFSFIALGFLFKKLQLKHIPLSLAVLLLLSAIGPWSARDVSYHSQYGRMQDTLKKHEMLVDGRIVKADKREDLPFEVRRNISGIADYIFRYDHEIYGFKDKYKFFEALGFKYVSRWENKRTEQAIKNGKFNYYYHQSGRVESFDVQGVDYYVPRRYVHINRKIPQEISLTEKINLSYQLKKENQLEVIVENKAIIFDLTNIADALLVDENRNNKLLAPIPLTQRQGAYQARINIFNLSGRIIDDKAKVDNTSMEFYITRL